MCEMHVVRRLGIMLRSQCQSIERPAQHMREVHNCCACCADCSKGATRAVTIYKQQRRGGGAAELIFDLPLGQQALGVLGAYLQAGICSVCTAWCCDGSVRRLLLGACCLEGCTLQQRRAGSTEIEGYSTCAAPGGTGDLTVC